MLNPVIQAIYFKNKDFLQKDEVEALSITFVSERYYDDCDDYVRALHEQEDELGMTVWQLLAIEGGDFDLQGRSKQDADTTIEKHLGWISYHLTEQDAEKWADQKREQHAKASA